MGASSGKGCRLRPVNPLGGGEDELRPALARCLKDVERAHGVHLSIALLVAGRERSVRERRQVNDHVPLRRGAACLQGADVLHRLPSDW